MKKYLLGGVIVLVFAGLPVAFLGKKFLDRHEVFPTYAPIPAVSTSPRPVVSAEPDGDPTPTVGAIPRVKVLPESRHVFQTFNNCGPASLSMALSYYGIYKSQEELGKALRPYQVKNGDNDDKSVSLDELGAKAEEFGLLAYHRPNGTPELLKQFIAHDMPVITVTWLKPNDDIGHYRMMRGYDDNQRVFIQDDSYQGKNLVYTYEAFNEIWDKFNYEYLVLVPKDKQTLAETILGADLDEKTAWTHAIELSEKQLQQDPENVDARFNLSVAAYYTGDYRRSVQEFEKVQSRLSFRTLWYQIEPLRAYYELGQYDKVLSISESILNNHNRAFSELYLLRGDVYIKQGKREAAREEYKKAVQYNDSMQAARDALNSV